MARLQVLCDLGDEGGLGQVADDLVRDLTVLEQKQRGDGHDAKLLSELALLVDVALVYVDLVGHLVCDLIDYGAERATRAAPACPEVDQNGFGRINDIALEVGGREFFCHVLYLLSSSYFLSFINLFASADMIVMRLLYPIHDGICDGCEVW